MGEVKNQETRRRKGKLPRDEIQKEDRPKYKIPDIEFRARNSLLTDLFESNDNFKAIYNIFVVVGIFVCLQHYAHDYAENGSVSFGLDIIALTLKNFHIGLFLWLAMFAATSMVFPAFKLWAAARQSFSNGIQRYFDICACFAVFCYIIGFMFVFTLATQILDLGFVPIFALLFEMFRLIMKFYAFIRSSSSESQAPFSHYLYFLFCPTLVYRESYPRTATIRWNYVFECLLNCIFGIYVLYLVYDLYVIKPFKKFEQITPSQFCLNVLKYIFPGTLITFAKFFLTLHCFQNGFAEIMRFADRKFYGAWWNVSKMAEFFRNINLLVSNWMLIYIYKDFYETVVKGNRFVALFIVGLLSAIAHEWWFMFSFSFFYPAFFVFYWVAGFPLMFVSFGKGNFLPKVLCLIPIFLNIPTMFLLYGLEYYARKNCFNGTRYSFTHYEPVSWTCSNTS